MPLRAVAPIPRYIPRRHIALILKIYRRHFGYKLRYVANHLNVSTSTVNYWEQYGTLDLRHLRMLANLYGFKMDVFYVKLTRS